MSLYHHLGFDIILSLVEFTMICMLATALLNKRHSIPFNVLVSFLAFTIAYVSSAITAENMFIKSALTITIYFVWLLICFKTDIFKALFISAFWMAYLLLFDNICISLFTVIFSVGLDEIIQDFYAYYVLCMAAKSIEILGIVFLRIRIRKHVNKSSPLHLLSNISILILPLTSVVISIYFAKVCISIPMFTREFLICSIIILFVNIISIFLLEYIDKQNEALKNNEILRQNLRSGLENIEAWKEAYSGQRKLTHDFFNQIAVVRGLVEVDAPKAKIVEYLDQLQNVKLPTEMLVNTHRIAVDVILNQKLAIAKNKKIQFNYHLDDLSEIPIPDDALIIILSNLIDNAIDAASKVNQATSRFISLKFRIIDDTYFLCIENTTAVPVVIENNNIVLPKDKSVSHGYGLKNVIYILEKYGVLYSMDYDEQKSVFAFSAQIIGK